MFVDFYRFYISYENDKNTNNQPAQIYDWVNKAFITTTWSEIRVGHIIKVKSDEIVPADIVLLEVVHTNHYCNVDESSITGVFDKFKFKKACTDTTSPAIKYVNFNEYVKKIKGMLKYDDPNEVMNSFQGRLKLESFPRASIINEENFVMRGSTIKNIKY